MSNNKVDNVIIADSQFIVVEGLKSLIGTNDRYCIAGTAATLSDLYKLLENNGIGLLITDFANFDYDGIDDLKAICVNFPQVVILNFTNAITRSEFTALTKLGVKNIIYKTAEKDEIFSAIESALRNRKFYSDEILDMILELGETKLSAEDQKHLTVSEVEIVKLIADGLTTKEIAAKRNISYHTVNTHRKNIFRKTEVSNASELIMHAIKAGWINNIEYYI